LKVVILILILNRFEKDFTQHWWCLNLPFSPPNLQGHAVDFCTPNFTMCDSDQDL